MNTPKVTIARWVCVAGAAGLLAAAFGARADGQVPPTTKTARLVFKEAGGWLAAENTLSLWDDGRVVYAISDVRGARTIQTFVPVREVELLKSLFEGVQFEKMPTSFCADGVVMDGMTYQVTFKHPNGTSHMVESETAAVEPVGFSMIREQCCALTQEVLDQVVFETTCQGGFTGEIRTLRVRASGEWLYRCETPGQPDRTLDASGVLPIAQLDRLSAALEACGFMDLPSCLGGHDGADVVVFESTALVDGEHHTVRFTALSPDLPHALVMVQNSMGKLIVRVEG
jgi:hypothetical protein